MLPVLAEQNLKTIDTERRHGGHFVRLRSIFFPIFERVMFELVFEKELPEDLNRILCASAENVRNYSSNVHSNVISTRTHCARTQVIEALKGGVLRDMNKRNRLTVEIERLLIKNQKALQLDSRLSSKEWALFLQGVVFTTAVVQLSEGAAHIGIALAQHPDVMRDLRSSKEKNLPYVMLQFENCCTQAHTLTHTDTTSWTRFFDCGPCLEMHIEWQVKISKFRMQRKERSR